MLELGRVGAVRTFKLARSVYGRALYFTAAYLVDGLLIDTGCAHTADELGRALADEDIRSIVNTHSHEDHIGGNALIQAQRNISAFVRPDGLSYVEQPRLRSLRPYQRIVWGYPEPSKAAPLGDAIETDRYHFRVIHTPGHSDDHVALFEPNEGLLFTGDAYVGGRDRTLRGDYNVWEIIESIETLAGLEPRMVLTGSGTVRENPGEEIRRKIDYLKEIGDRILDLHKQGLSYRRIRNRLFGREMLMTYLTGGHFSGINLVRSFVEDAARGSER